MEQQIELYDSGVILAYDRYHVEDQLGALSQVPLAEDEWSLQDRYRDLSAGGRRAATQPPFLTPRIRITRPPRQESEFALVA